MTEQPVNGALSLAVERIIYHNQYRPKGLDYDIALMRLAQPLEFNGTGVHLLNFTSHLFLSVLFFT